MTRSTWAIAAILAVAAGTIPRAQGLTFIPQPAEQKKSPIVVDFAVQKKVKPAVRPTNPPPTPFETPAPEPIDCAMVVRPDPRYQSPMPIVKPDPNVTATMKVVRVSDCKR